MSAISLVNQSIFSSYHQNNILLSLPIDMLGCICSLLSRGENVVENGTNLSKFGQVCKFTNGLIKSFAKGSIVGLAISNAKSTINLQTLQKGKNENQDKLRKYEFALESSMEHEGLAYDALRDMIKHSPESYEDVIQMKKLIDRIRLEQNALTAQINSVKEALARIDQEIDQIANPTLGAMEISPAQQN